MLNYRIRDFNCCENCKWSYEAEPTGYKDYECMQGNIHERRDKKYRQTYLTFDHVHRFGMCDLHAPIEYL